MNNIIIDKSKNINSIDNLIKNLSIDESNEDYILIDLYNEINQFLNKVTICKVNKNFYNFICKISKQNNYYLKEINFDKIFYEKRDDYSCNDIKNILLIYNKLNQSIFIFNNLSKNKKLWNISNIYNALKLTRDAYKIIIYEILLYTVDEPE